MFTSLTRLLEEEAEAQSESLKALDNYLYEILDEEREECLKVSSKNEKAWKKLCILIDTIDFKALKLKEVILKRYGSSETLFKTRSSDIDCTLLTGCYVDERAMIEILYELLPIIQKRVYPCMNKWKFSKIDGHHVRIPLLSMMVPIEDEQSVKIELTINNILGVVNTKLLDIYSRIDQRVADLGILIKLWAKKNHFCSGKDALSSYAYINLVINFLQTTDPPVLPNLQKKQGEVIWIQRVIENGKLDIQPIDIGFEKDIERIKSDMAKSPNCSRLGLLLRQFCFTFQHFFIYRTISIRLGAPVSKNQSETDYFVSIEDPFDDTHNLGRSLLKGSKKSRDLKFTLQFQARFLLLEDLGVKLMFKDESSNPIQNQQQNDILLI